ncbi:ETS domain-containing protein [Salinisphaera sp. G21_0]|uniref:ETS domain-containing protein n=1 Tax=Salinisphaera sp. G21_0 TaxID=2821094 RepID=UPI001ADCA607|nr:ETS domain-containing protein [Salinisphaera sp. G21_0]MBO9483747.1 ETS domain-containing protein [Salinisphaera sp. G21_0]
MSNPICANNTLNKISNPNDDQLHQRYSTTVRYKEKHPRYTPYTTTRQICTNDHFNSRQHQTNLSQRQMEINYQPLNHLNPPYFLQNTYDDNPGVRSNIFETMPPFETMHPYFSDAGIISQPQSYEEPNKPAYNSTSTNIRNTQLTHKEPDTDYFTGIRKNPESPVVVNSGARAESTEQVKGLLPFPHTQYSQRVGYFQMERYTFYDQHQLSKPKSDKKKRKINNENSLWKFILHNIINNRDSSISWVNIRQGIFEFKDLDKFSEQWTTHRKRTTPIIFENIARSIRNYYTTGIMTKFDQYGTHLPRQHYRFNLSNPVVADYFKTIGLMP